MKTPAGKLFCQENIELFSESDDSDFQNSEDCLEPPKKRAKRNYCHMCPKRKGFSHLKCSKCKQSVCKKHLVNFCQNCSN